MFSDESGRLTNAPTVEAILAAMGERRNSQRERGDGSI